MAFSKVLAVVYSVCLILTLIPSLEATRPQYKVSNVKQPQKIVPKAIGVRDNVTECLDCIDVMFNIIDILVNALANGGVIGSCTDLCGYLPYQAEFIACDLLCSYAGIEAFIQGLDAVDPDPIYLCEIITICPIKDNARGRILSYRVSPTSGPQGTTFYFTIVYQILSPIGTGDIDLTVFPPDGSFPVGGDDFVVGQNGTYSLTFDLSTDPTETDPFEPGVYNATATICEGLCGSIHAHSYTLDTKTIPFTITNSDVVKTPMKPTKVHSMSLTKPKAIPHVAGPVACTACIDFFDETLDELLNIFLNLAIGGGCEDACSQLPEPWEIAVCTTICLFVGVDAFANFLNDVDIDPIYLCTALELCPANTCTDKCTNITRVTVSPQVAPLRTTFLINVYFHVFQPTGTGVNRALLVPPGGDNGNGPIVIENVNEGYAVGTYNDTIVFETDWEDWNYPYGTYTMLVQSCASDCDNPHGIIFSSATANLTITQ